MADDIFKIWISRLCGSGAPASKAVERANSYRLPYEGIRDSQAREAIEAMRPGSAGSALHAAQQASVNRGLRANRRRH